MTEYSRPWAGTTTGDAGPYSDDQWTDLWRYFFLFDRAAEGPIVGILNELEPTGVTSPVAVNTGVAMVDGKFYLNDASEEDVTIPTPTTNPRIDRIVLRKGWTAQTVRLYRIAGTEDPSPSPPSIDQTDGVTWDVMIAQVHITTSGTVTVTDEREFAWGPMSALYFVAQKQAVVLDGDVMIADSGEDVGAKFETRPMYAEIPCFSMRDAEPHEVGEGKAFLHIPPFLDGWHLSYAHAETKEPGTSGVLEIQIHNIDNALDMLTDLLTVDDGDTGSDESSSPVVINASNDHVNANDLLRIDFDTIHGTPGTGALISVGFEPGT
ncbi:hypothetical protein ES705_07279 [subsurface metagenome]